MIQKQANHLLSEIGSSNTLENKLIGCSAIILTGLAYKNEKNYLENGLGILKKFIKILIFTKKKFQRLSTIIFNINQALTFSHQL